MGCWERSTSTDAGAQFLDDFPGGFAGCFLFGDTKGDGADPSMTAAPVALAHLGQIYRRLGRGPGIRSYRNLYPKAALAEAHAVDRLGMEIVGDELVVAFEILVTDIKVQGAISGFGAFS